MTGLAQDNSLASDLRDIQRQNLEELRKITNELKKSGSEKEKTSDPRLASQSNPYAAYIPQQDEMARIRNAESSRVANENAQQLKGELSKSVFGSSRFVGGRAVGYEEQALLSKQIDNNISNSAITGAMGAVGIAASALIPGMIAGTAAGALITAPVGAYVDQRKQYQENEMKMLKESYRFISPLETNNTRKGSGFTDTEASEAGDFLRKANTDSFLEDKDVKDIFNGLLEGGMMKSTSDLNSFKKNVTKMIEFTKEGAVALNATFKEITSFMSDMKKIGLDVDNTSFNMGLGKMAGSFLGIDAKSAQTMLINNTAEKVYGTSKDAQSEFVGTANQIVMASSAREWSKNMSDGVVDVFRNTDVAGISGMFASSSKQFANSNPMARATIKAAMEFKDGKMVLNKELMQQNISDGLSFDDYTNIIQEKAKNKDWLVGSSASMESVIDDISNSTELSSTLSKSSIKKTLEKMNLDDTPENQRFALSASGINASNADVMIGMNEFVGKNPGMEDRLRKSAQLEAWKAKGATADISAQTAIKQGWNKFMDNMFSPNIDENKENPYGLFYDMKNYQYKDDYDRTLSLSEGKNSNVEIMKWSTADHMNEKVISSSPDEIIANTNISIRQGKKDIEKLIRSSSGDPDFKEKKEKLEATIASDEKKRQEAQYSQNKKVDIGLSNLEMLKSAVDPKYVNEVSRKYMSITGQDWIGKLANTVGLGSKQDTIQESEERFKKGDKYMISLLDNEKTRSGIIENAKNIDINIGDYNNLRTDKDKKRFIDAMATSFDTAAGDGAPDSGNSDKVVSSAMDDHTKAMEKMTKSIVEAMAKERKNMEDVARIMGYGYNLRGK